MSPNKQPFRIVQAVLKRCNVPEHTSKYSNRIFTNHQHLYLLILKTFARLSYRRTELFVHCFVQADIGLKRTPNYSTPSKFLKRIPAGWIMASMLAFTHVFRTLLIDGTGFSNECSKYYEVRVLGKTAKRSFTKVVLAATPSGMAAALIHAGKGSEAGYLVPILQKFCHRKIRRVLGDKGYDSLENFNYCRSRGIDAVIPVREGARHGLRRRLLERSKTDAFLRKYHGRSLVESMFHAVKQKYGGTVRARRPELQFKEIALKFLTHNLEKEVSFCRF